MTGGLVVGVCYHSDKGPGLSFSTPGCQSGSYCPEWSISVSVRRGQTWQDGNPNTCLQDWDHLRSVQSPSQVQFLNIKPTHEATYLFLFQKIQQESLYTQVFSCTWATHPPITAHLCLWRLTFRLQNLDIKGLQRVKAFFKAQFHRLFSWITMKSNTPQCYNLADNQRQHFMPPNVQTHNRHSNRNTLIANLMTKHTKYCCPLWRLHRVGGKLKLIRHRGNNST